MNTDATTYKVHYEPVAFERADRPGREQEPGYYIAEVGKGRDGIVGGNMFLFDSHGEATKMIPSAAKFAAQQPRKVTATETRSPMYGQGMRYSDTPGATHYQNDNGHHSVQIWDES